MRISTKTDMIKVGDRTVLYGHLTSQFILYKRSPDSLLIFWMLSSAEHYLFDIF